MTNSSYLLTILIFRRLNLLKFIDTLLAYMERKNWLTKLKLKEKNWKKTEKKKLKEKTDVEKLDHLCRLWD